MNRNLFFSIVTVDGVQELDLMDEALDGFKLEIKRQVEFYRVTDADLVRPDFISFKFYGNERFWWIIMVINDIIDIRADLVAGMLLQIPDVLDIYDYFKKKRKR